MKHRAFIFAAFVSLALCVVILVLWPLGCWRRLTIHYRFGITQWGMQTESGSLSVVYYEYPKVLPRGWFGGTFEIDPADRSWPLRFGYLHREPMNPMDNRSYAAWCPNWFIAGLLGIPPTLWFAQHRRRRIIERDRLCPRCGYDLRGTPDHCPECGRTACE